MTATERVGRYQLLEPIGVGPNGTVSRAKVFGVAGFERQFALKRFHPELTATAQLAAALSSAARAYGSLEHPRIARMSEFGVAQGTTFTAVELVVGIDALRLISELRLAGTSLPAGGALALVSQAARAIGYAHGRGISHLGIAPTNLLVTADGDVKITDFGILAATLPVRPVEQPRLAHRLAYLAPEQLANEAASAATDVFALGVLAHELVTGARAFRGDTPQQIAHAVMTGATADLPLPRPIVRVLQRCLARSPFERFPDARAFADALDAALRVAPVPGTRKDVSALVTDLLARLAELAAGEMSGVVALNVGTANPRAAAPPPPPGAPTMLGTGSLRDDGTVLGTGVPGRDGHAGETDAGATVPSPPPTPRAPSRPTAPRITGLAAATSASRTIPDLPKLPPAKVTGPAPVGIAKGSAAPPASAPKLPGPPPSATLLGVPRPRIKVKITPPSIPIEPEPGLSDRPSETPVSPLRAAAAAAPPLPDETVLGAGGARVAPDPGTSDATTAEPLDMSVSITGDLMSETSVVETHELEQTRLGVGKPDRGAASTESMPPLMRDQLALAAAARSTRELEAMAGAASDDVPRPPVDDPPPPSLEIVPLAPMPVAPMPVAPMPVAPMPMAPMPMAPITRPTSDAIPSLASAAARQLPLPPAPPLAPMPPPPPIALRPAPPPPRSRLRWVVAGASTAVVLGGVAVVLYTQLAGADDGGDHPAVAATHDAGARAAPPVGDAGRAVVATGDAGAAPVPARDAGTTVAVAVARDAAPAVTDPLSITSKPAGARVYLDGADAGVTPVELPGTPDRHTVALLLPGHELYAAQVDGHGEFAISLKEVTPTGGPAGIKVIRCKDKDRYYVFVDGKPTGMTCPTERIETELGPHTVEVYDLVSETRRKWEIVVKETRLSFRVRVE